MISNISISVRIKCWNIYDLNKCFSFSLKINSKFKHCLQKLCWSFILLHVRDQNSNFSQNENLCSSYLLICRQLCQLLTAEDIFKSFSQIIVDEADVGFACKIVQTLNTILLTSAELFELRTQLKNLDTQVCAHLMKFFQCKIRDRFPDEICRSTLCNFSHTRYIDISVRRYITSVRHSFQIFFVSLSLQMYISKGDTSGCFIEQVYYSYSYIMKNILSYHLHGGISWPLIFVIILTLKLFENHHLWPTVIEDRNKKNPVFYRGTVLWFYRKSMLYFTGELCSVLLSLQVLVSQSHSNHLLVLSDPELSPRQRPSTDLVSLVYLDTESNLQPF